MHNTSTRQLGPFMIHIGWKMCDDVEHSLRWYGTYVDWPKATYPCLDRQSGDLVVGQAPAEQAPTDMAAEYERLDTAAKYVWTTYGPYSPGNNLMSKCSWLESMYLTLKDQRDTLRDKIDEIEASKALMFDGDTFYTMEWSTLENRRSRAYTFIHKHECYCEADYKPDNPDYVENLKHTYEAFHRLDDFNNQRRWFEDCWVCITLDGVEIVEAHSPEYEDDWLDEENGKNRKATEDEIVDEAIAELKDPKQIERFVRHIEKSKQALASFTDALEKLKHAENPV